MRLHISGRLVTRNVALTLVAQTLPLLIGLIAVPVILRELGSDLFGLLSLAWIIVGYFAILDLGLGRAATKFIAEAAGQGQTEVVPSLYWTTVCVQAFLGIAGGLLLIAMTPWLVDTVIKTPPELRTATQMTLYVLAMAIPLVMISSSLSGLLEAYQRLDIVNGIRLVSSAMTYLLSLYGALQHWSLPAIVASIVLLRLATAIALFCFDLRVFPGIKRPAVHLAHLPRLLRFGGWVTVSSVLAPFLVSAERFLLSALRSVSAVAFYAAPYEAATSLWIVPASVTMTVYPAFSTLAGVDDQRRLYALVTRSLKYILLVSGPLALVLIVFAAPLMDVWVGDTLPQESTIALQVLAAGILVNSLAHIPSALLQASGRPDAPAKFHMLEAALYIVLAWRLIGAWGVVGAALAWTLRVALDGVLLFAGAVRLGKAPVRAILAPELTASVQCLAALAVALGGARLLTSGLPAPVGLVLASALLILFALVAWRVALNAAERDTILSALRRTSAPGV